MSGRLSIRVLIVDEGPGVWGAQKYLLRLAPILADKGIEQVLGAPADCDLAREWRAAGREHVDLAAPTRRVRVTEESRVSARLAAREWQRTRQRAAEISALALGTGADVIHANVHWSHLEGALAARSIGRHSLLVLHEESRPGVAGHLRGAAVRLADRTVAVSRAVRDRVPAWARWGVDVIANGIDTDTFRPGPVDPAVRCELAADPTAPIVLVTCRLDPGKQVDHVIQAVARTPVAANVHLAIAGAPSLDPTTEPRLRRMGEHLLGPRVRFLGPRHDIAPLLRAADVVALASAIEGMPLSILEAQACGRPVVAYPTAGVPEIVEHEITGLLVPDGDIGSLSAAITRVLSDDQLRTQVAAAARAFVVARHDIRDQARQHAALLHRIIDPRSAIDRELVA